jgi:hypothetical protein
MCDSFNGINDRASVIISGISTVFLSGSMMRNFHGHSEKYWISQALKLVLHVHFSTDAPVLISPIFFISGEHFIEYLKVLIN